MCLCPKREFLAFMSLLVSQTNKVGTHQLGCSQVWGGGGGGGGSWGSAEPLLQINDIHDYCYALEKLRAEMYVLYIIPTFYAHSTHT